MIQLYGTMDNYNSEYTEHLHIDLVKDAYRTTNHKDEFMQMTQWLEHKEKLQNHINETLSHRHLEDLTANIVLPFHSVAVHHKIKWVSIDARGHGDPCVTVDSVHAKPACFNTVLINDGTGDSVGIEEQDMQLMFPPTHQPPKHLAYIEWFTPFSLIPDSRHVYTFYRSLNQLCLITGQATLSSKNFAREVFPDVAFETNSYHTLSVRNMPSLSTNQCSEKESFNY
ncbi:uncharacterized protein EDB93DRAFT_1108366 [Suillus bovinus]|uniref:uncharacterized protein n=1 Tax=Suillus bovinus TaxID=48563 RepID=UPI001B8642CD|nr:uncharacterized protein EDB93DRAFT_1108366 [Suillus bovinus]KAG2130637.1 hypothetical protein EDB93DRAFT_1108366 [Suillus bovinus]